MWRTVRNHFYCNNPEEKSGEWRGANDGEIFRSLKLSAMVSLWIVELRRGSELGNEVEMMPFTKTEPLEEKQLYAER